MLMRVTGKIQFVGCGGSAELASFIASQDTIYGSCGEQLEGFVAYSEHAGSFCGASASALGRVHLHIWVGWMQKTLKCLT